MLEIKKVTTYLGYADARVLAIAFILCILAYPYSDIMQFDGEYYILADTVDVGDEQSEQNHQYQSDGEQIEKKYQSYRSGKPALDDGRNVRQYESFKVGCRV
jgi:hypothetical protein